MYRAATVAALRAGADLADPAAITRAVAAADIAVTTAARPATVTLDGSDVTAEIRSPLITQSVSAVAAVPAVRTQLVALQRELIGAGGIVVEGRDIASTVWPQAETKVYLTASEDVRTRRRAGETGEATGPVAASLRRRDALDSSRTESPLRRADGAVELDTTDLSVDGVVAALARLVDQSR
jgi:CMP/dCMP kinase